MFNSCHRGQKGESLDRRVEENLRQKPRRTQRRRRGREELQGRSFGEALQGRSFGEVLQGEELRGRSFERRSRGRLGPVGIRCRMASASPAATMSGRGARNLLQFLRLVGQLKRVPRTGWVYRNVQKPESVSDHMYRMAVMALVTKDERLNKDRCVRLALVHDMAECIVGDIAPADN
ncbi:HDDC2, partial [Cervus elaphus hippelaphus]